ncbi:MAG: cytochrome c [Acidobacteriia bacterium]|nr:cytochrome c [Terriglobia bacterium]
MTRRTTGTYLFGSIVWTGALLVCLGAGRLAQEPQSKSATVDDIQRHLIHSVEGQDLYRAYCASCHGLNATGNGPVAPALKAVVPDLTTISHRNGGIFPRPRIRKIIAGDDDIISHGSREMPIWGPIFHQVEQDRDWGLVRLDNLAKYLESIQKK